MALFSGTEEQPKTVTHIPTTAEIAEQFNKEELHKYVTVSEFEETCLANLKERGRLNNVTRVMVSNITALYSTALECEQDIQNNGVMMESIGSTGQVITKRNEAVMLQDKAVNSIGKLLAQLGLDEIEEEQESEV